MVDRSADPWYARTMPRKPLLATRHSVLKPDGFLTLMVVLTRRTFKWTFYTKHILWAVGIALAVWTVAVLGSVWGLWATKKMMSFDDLQRETREQQEQLKESLEQADMLQKELNNLQALVQDLMQQIDPKQASQGLTDDTAERGLTKDHGHKVSALQNELDSIDGSLKKFQTQMAPVFYRYLHTPSIAPTAGFVSSGYGTRIHPFSRAGGDGDGLLSMHTGIDIANEMGTPVQVTANGEVTFSDWSANYGLTVVVKHTPELETLYAHLQSSYVKPGQKVERGTVIGLMGRTGRATGVHLHYEVRRNGAATNPKPYLQLQRQWLTGLK
jgi:murein DD-endopeptidase MepM/ murein hydrolase activator NlpD